MALTEKLTAIGDAIRSKTGGGEKLTLEQMVTEIEGISTGSGGGTDTGEEWIGDGNTHIWIKLYEGRTSPKLGLILNGTATIDWGDGTEKDIMTGTSEAQWIFSNVHDYRKAGNYHITVAIDGNAIIKGQYPGTNIQEAKLLMGEGGGEHAYNCRIRRVEIGTGISCLHNYALTLCYGLEALMIPDTVSEIRQYMCSGSRHLSFVRLPSNATKIPKAGFIDCKSLAGIVIPPTVTSVDMGAFERCEALRRVDFSRHTAVPELVYFDVFADVAPDCEILVPAALYEEWIAATNWVTFASMIKAV